MSIMKRDDGEPERGRARLKNIRFDELSLVDKPANPRAVVTLVKRRDTENEDMDIEKIGGDEVASFSSFTEAVDHLQKIHGGGRSAAMSKAASAFPSLLDAYQREGEQIAKAAAEKGGSIGAISLEGVLTQAMDRFQRAVTDAMSRRGLSRSAAMSEVGNNFPELRAEAFGEPAPVGKRSGAATAARQKFDILVGSIMDRDKVSRSVAMTRARAEHPDAYAALQAA